MADICWICTRAAGNPTACTDPKRHALVEEKPTTKVVNPGLKLLFNEAHPEIMALVRDRFYTDPYEGFGEMSTILAEELTKRADAVVTALAQNKLPSYWAAAESLLLSASVLNGAYDWLEKRCREIDEEEDTEKGGWLQ
jgi:hypothetical protein